MTRLFAWSTAKRSPLLSTATPSGVLAKLTESRLPICPAPTPNASTPATGTGAPIPAAAAPLDDMDNMAATIAARTRGVALNSHSPRVTELRRGLFNIGNSFWSGRFFRWLLMGAGAPAS